MLIVAIVLSNGPLEPFLVAFRFSTDIVITLTRNLAGAVLIALATLTTLVAQVKQVRVMHTMCARFGLLVFLIVQVTTTGSDFAELGIGDRRAAASRRSPCLQKFVRLLDAVVPYICATLIGIC